MILIGRGLDFDAKSERLIGKRLRKFRSRMLCSCQGAERESQQFPVAMAKGFHLFPYRTQKLRPSAPMVLGWTRPGRVGRRRIPRSLHKECSFFVVQDERKLRMRSILMGSDFWGCSRQTAAVEADAVTIAFYANMLRMRSTQICLG